MAFRSDCADSYALRPGVIVWVGPDRADGLAVLQDALDKGERGDGWCLWTDRGGRWYPLDQIEVADVPDAWGDLARQCVLEVQRAKASREEARRTLATVSGACEQYRDVIDDVRAALGNGIDVDTWPPGLTVAAAVSRLRVRLCGSRTEVERLRALLHDGLLDAVNAALGGGDG